MWARKNKQRVDGVAAIDPTALERLVASHRTGSAASRARGWTEPTPPKVLLNDVYFDFPANEQQDAFFGRAASAIFDNFIDETCRR